MTRRKRVTLAEALEVMLREGSKVREAVDEGLRQGQDDVYAYAAEVTGHSRDEVKGLLHWWNYGGRGQE